MTTRQARPRTVRAHPGADGGAASRARGIVGGFFLFTGGVHLGIVGADPQFYANFADGALFPVVRDGWAEVFMVHPSLWGLALVVYETTLGALLLRGGRWVRFGWAGVIAFHLGLMLFGWGFWLWSVPALALLVPMAVADRRQGGQGHPGVQSPSCRSRNRYREAHEKELCHDHGTRRRRVDVR